jgi:hydroxymethylbilane synthase
MMADWRRFELKEKRTRKMMTPLILGTRGSELALMQTTMVTQALHAAVAGVQVEREIIHTIGDKRTDLRFADFHGGAVPLADKGIFIKELEVALDEARVHAAVHSLKDVPSELEARFQIAAVLARAPIEDVLITREPVTLESLRPGARIGTSSVRRARQIKWLRPDVEIVEIRGNVGTRVRKVLGEQPLDAVMLAAAGLLRLGLMDAERSEIRIDDQVLSALSLDPVTFLPAAGQGAVAIECLGTSGEVIALLRSINHAETEARVTAEREFLKILGAGCQTPVGAHTWLVGEELHMRVRVFNEQDASAPPVEREAHAPVCEARALAAELAAGL